MPPPYETIVRPEPRSWPDLILFSLNLFSSNLNRVWIRGLTYFEIKLKRVRFGLVCQLGRLFDFIWI